MMKTQINTRYYPLCRLLVILLLTTNYSWAQVTYEQPLKGTEDGIGFLLSWTISADSQVDYFSIERALEGNDFKTIGSVKAELTGVHKSYSFKDMDLGLETVRYRLKHLLRDGRSSYSPHIVLHKEFTTYFEVIQKESISSDIIQVSINSIKNAELECRVTNNMGDIIIEELRPIEVGINDLVFDLSSEIDDTYLLIFKQDNIMETVVFKKETKDKKDNVADGKSNKRGG